MTTEKSQISFKETAAQWQAKASSHRDADAKRAGVNRNSANDVDYVKHGPKRSSKRGTKNLKRPDDSTELSRDSEILETKDLRRSMLATRISQPEKGIDIYYHEPVNVRFKSIVPATES